jgi:hypothetical protein
MSIPSSEKYNTIYAKIKIAAPFVKKDVFQSTHNALREIQNIRTKIGLINLGGRINYPIRDTVNGKRNDGILSSLAPKEKKKFLLKTKLFQVISPFESNDSIINQALISNDSDKCKIPKPKRKIPKINSKVELNTLFENTEKRSVNYSFMKQLSTVQQNNLAKSRTRCLNQMDTILYQTSANSISRSKPKISHYRTISIDSVYGRNSVDYIQIPEVIKNIPNHKKNKSFQPIEEKVIKRNKSNLHDSRLNALKLIYL